MPTNRLPKFGIDGNRRSEAKENVVGPFALPGKLSGGRMVRKRSRTDPGDPMVGSAAVLRLSQEANSSNDNDGDSTEGVAESENKGKESAKQRISGAKLFAQSMRKLNGLEPGNSKKRKLSAENNSVLNALLFDDGRANAASNDARESVSPSANASNSASISSSKRDAAGTPVNRCRASPTAAESNQSKSRSLLRGVSKLSLRSRKTEEQGAGRVAAAGENADENSVTYVNNGDENSVTYVKNEQDTTVVGAAYNPFAVPVIAPALRNLGNTCFLNSIMQVLYYTPTFVDSVTVLYKELQRTISDLSAIRTVSACELKIQREYISFIIRLHSLFVRMRQDENLFLNGLDSEAIIPDGFLDGLAKLSELFQRREQQDCHEFLRCVLHYVQEATRMINIQRDVHSDVTRSDGNRSPSTVDAGDGTATGLTSLQSENGCTSESAGSYVHCPLQSTPESCEPHVVDSVFSPLSDVTRVPTVNLQHGCLSDTSCGGHSSPDSPQQAKSAEPGSGCLDNLAPQKSKSSAGKITDYFARSPPAAPRTAADLTVTTRKVADFVEWLCEGKSERITRCLECECTTRCTETFQDVEVVAQKADCRTRTSRSDPHSSDDDTDKEICWIVKSLEEVETLDGDNKYWCSNCMHHTEAQRSVSYQRLPKILSVHIKRFAGFGGGYMKVMACVHIPFVLPCLEADCNDSTADDSTHSRQWYELYAVVCHSGFSLSSGHYLSYIRAPPSNATATMLSESTSEDIDNVGGSSMETGSSDTDPIWLLCNDDVVTALFQSELKRKLEFDRVTTPYMLFYRRMPAQ